MTKAHKALDEIENTISEIIKLAYNNNITTLSKIKFERQCKIIRESLGLVNP